jgi:hypothetical protein
MRASRRLLAAVCAAALAGPLAAASAAGHDVLFRIQPAEVDESSSLVVSQTHPGLVYTANDSGGSATVYVLDDRTGELVGTTSIEGVDPLDIEAMTPGGHGSLLVADIGDNANDRPYATVYRIDEPGTGTHTAAADSVRVTYATGAHNAEAVVYNPASGRLYIATKQFAGAHVYRSPPDLFAHRHVVMKAVARGPALATDAALVPGGSFAVIRTYFSAYFYTFPGWQPLAERDLPNQPQGESLAVPAGGDQLWIGSEGEHSRVLAVGVPDLTPPTTAPPTFAPPPTGATGGDGGGEAQDEHRQQLKSRAILIGGGAFALFAIVLVVIAVRWHRHPRVD